MRPEIVLLPLPLALFTKAMCAFYYFRRESHYHDSEANKRPMQRASWDPPSKSAHLLKIAVPARPSEGVTR